MIVESTLLHFSLQVLEFRFKDNAGGVDSYERVDLADLSPPKISLLVLCLCHLKVEFWLWVSLFFFLSIALLV